MRKQNRNLAGRAMIRASAVAEPPVIEASGTSEGVRKSWESRSHGLSAEAHTATMESASTEVLPETVRAREVIQCRASGVPISARKQWATGEPVDFQWMPAGVSTIHASYGRGENDQRPIELTVLCDESCAAKVQAAFAAIKANNPRRPPFVCIEHQAKERAGEPIEFKWGAIDFNGTPEYGIICTHEPSELGARNVNGRIHSSFSPTFDTDADYASMICDSCSKSPGKCKCGGKCGWSFPVGARGSASNPARVVAPDSQSVGSLTNWNAFRDILPIAAREADKPVVEAAGTSEGVRKSWETRHTGSGKSIPHISDDVYTKSEKVAKWNVAVHPLMDRDVGGRQLKQRLPGWSKSDHEDAAKAHMQAAGEHASAWSDEQSKAHRETFGKEPEFHDYRVSGIGRDEYSEESKDALRNHAHSKSAHTSAAHAHWKASGHHGVTTDELKTKVGATSTASTETVRATSASILASKTRVTAESVLRVMAGGPGSGPRAGGEFKYAETPHKTIGEILKDAHDRAANGEHHYDVANDLIDGYGLGHGSRNGMDIHAAAKKGSESAASKTKASAPQTAQSILARMGQSGRPPATNTQGKNN